MEKLRKFKLTARWAKLKRKVWKKASAKLPEKIIAPKPKHLLDLPLELQYQIFECLLPSRTRRISLDGPPRKEGQAVRILSRNCKELHMNPREWFKVKDYFIKSRHFGLIDPDRTVFKLDVKSSFRCRMGEEAL
jgi:hypothetical protein